MPSPYLKSFRNSSLQGSSKVLHGTWSALISFWNFLSHHRPTLTGHCPPQTPGTFTALCPSRAFPSLQIPTSTHSFQTELRDPRPSPARGGNGTLIRVQFLGLTVRSSRLGPCLIHLSVQSQHGAARRRVAPRASEWTRPFRWAAATGSAAGHGCETLHQPLGLLTPRAHHSWRPSSAPWCWDRSCPSARA